MSIQAVIKGVGGYLPERIVSNADMMTIVETDETWIRERTGIEKRHYAAKDEFTSHLAIKAALSALLNAGMDAQMIDGIIVATSTPDTTMPSVACKVQAALGIADGAALDVNAACAGFVYALSVAQGWIATGIAKHILVIGAETMSRIMNWQDRTTCILFGDGAGALVLSAEESGANAKHTRGILAMSLCAQGDLMSLLGTDGGVSSTQNSGALFMAGKEVFRHGVEKMASITLSTLKKTGISLDDIDYIVAHQANARMISAIAKELKIDAAKAIVTVDKHANTSAASIPLALWEAQKLGKLSHGKLIAMPALGAGLTWGCCIIRW